MTQAGVQTYSLGSDSISLTGQDNNAFRMERPVSLCVLLNFNLLNFPLGAKQLLANDSSYRVLLITKIVTIIFGTSVLLLPFEGAHVWPEGEVRTRGGQGSTLVDGVVTLAGVGGWGRGDRRRWFLVGTHWVD